MIDLQPILHKIITMFISYILSASAVTAIPTLTTIQPPITPSPSQKPTLITNPATFPTIYTSNVDSDKPWGEAWRQEDGSYTLKIQEDPVMSTPRELAEAINRYRETKGVGRLEWSDTLSAYAQTRAEYIATNGSDHHAGFNNYIQNEDGYSKLGFNCLGENMSEGFRLSGTHLVEWMYAQSPGHDANQLNTIYSRIGVGISEKISVLIFGGCF